MSKDKVRGAPFTLGSFGLAPVVHTRLVVLTFNPTGYSFVHWLRASLSPNTLGPEHAVAGIALLAAG